VVLVVIQEEEEIAVLRFNIGFNVKIARPLTFNKEARKMVLGQQDKVCGIPVEFITLGKF